MNMDVMNEKMNALLDSIGEGASKEEFGKRLAEYVNMSAMEVAEQRVMDKYRELADITDENILAARGMHICTSEEKKFYDWMKTAARPKNEYTDTEIALPVTIENRVYENMRQTHELLRHINFVDSRGTTQWLISKNLDYAYAWGNLNDAVTEEAAAAFAIVEFSNFKLSAYVPVPITMLQLGVMWLDQFTVEYLSEIMARALEAAVVTGNGQKQPVGMTKTVNIEEQTVPAQDKTADKITDLNPKTIGAIAATLSNKGMRDVGVIDMIVNPVDYWTTVYPAMTANIDGTFVHSNAPLRVIRSHAVPTGKAIFGLCENYFATVGFGVPNGRIEYSDHYKFLEDIRTYKARCVAYGTPVDDNSFVYKDISGLKTFSVPVTVENTVTTTVDGTVTTTTAGE